MEPIDEKEPRAAGRVAHKLGTVLPNSLRVIRKSGHVQGKQKNEAVQRLLQGEDLWKLSNELGVTVGRILYWKEIYSPAGTDQASGDDDLVRILKRELELLRRENEELRNELRR
jgi:hypothetical protein